MNVGVGTWWLWLIAFCLGWWVAVAELTAYLF